MVVLNGLSSIFLLGILCFLGKSVVSSMVLVVPTHLLVSSTFTSLLIIGKRKKNSFAEEKVIRHAWVSVE